ncbi:hypothetical protein [Aeromonas sp. MdU4]|uniref:hypothetical protein n=1 Tax=Aeromonas sp. MdU4 TaxID=3342819 RepID=UPI0035BB6CD8
MKVKTYISFMAMALSISGCSLVDKATEGYAIDPLKPAGSGFLDSAMALCDTSATPPVVNEFEGKNHSSALCNTKEKRNAAISSLMIASEEQCLVHRRHIYGNEAVANGTLGTFTNIFAGAAAVVTPETTKSILAALALFTNSERSLMNETVYKQMLVTAVDKKIVEQRQAKAEKILGEMNDPVDKYTFEQATFDVMDFHSSCSFMEGLRLALEEGTNGAEYKRIAEQRSLRVDIEQVNQDIKSNSSDTEYVDKLKVRRDTLMDKLNKI